MYRIARNIWSSPAKWRDVKCKKNRMEMRLNNIYIQLVIISSLIIAWRTKPIYVSILMRYVLNSPIKKYRKNQQYRLLNLLLKCNWKKTFSLSSSAIAIFIKEMTFPNDKVLLSIEVKRNKYQVALSV